MRYYFIDTNVILDLLANRTPFVEEAAQLFDLAEKKMVRLYCSAISFNNIYYILRKFSNHKNALESLTLLQSFVKIIDLDKKILFQALESQFGDYEDAIQHLSALTNPRIEAIITRNVKDFKHAKTKVITPEMALYNLKEVK